ncbi:MAG: DUF998 domain-containing protein [Candidatus Bathyarchaeota archaeon]|jgi:hypothetical membrane protein
MLKVNDYGQRLIWWGGLGGIVGSVLTLAMVFASTLISPWFRWDSNALSELGVGEVSLLFNAAVIISGIFNFLFAIGLREYLPRGQLAKVGVVFVMLGSVSLFLVGIFTISYPILHGIVALGEFLLAPIGFILIGLSVKDNTLKKFSISAGIGALIAILVLPIFLLVSTFKVGFAVPEMIEGLIVAAWVIFMGTRLLRA